MCRELHLIRSQGRLRDDGIQFQSGRVEIEYRDNKTAGLKEGDISDCKSDTWGSHMNGSMLHQGRWGTICADEFTNREADVVCRKAGIRLWFDLITTLTSRIHAVTSPGFATNILRYRGRLSDKPPFDLIMETVTYPENWKLMLTKHGFQYARTDSVPTMRTSYVECLDTNM
ncbi:hypothetical protein DPMN_035953 [Dreissena polymorpha]|uniref:SRCR domain-containing protein n=1 Tax=Dreissena polymorpha TaxID=45954 RepID=A0A9D4RL19_DREPO|nr:hypothetical protein DPMN_035953 [Dreissena polymorpha]